MPWYDPESDPETHDFFEFVEGLRQHKPRKRTSTFQKDSPTAILGEAGEIVVVGRVQAILEKRGLSWKVGRSGTPNSRVKRAITFSPDDDIWTPIENSRQGDVHVVDHRGKRRLSFEVKASLKYPNAAISESELLYSEAEYFVGVTTAGFWACSMDEARKHAYLKHGPTGSFYVIPHDSVRNVDLASLFPEV